MEPKAAAALLTLSEEEARECAARHVFDVAYCTTREEVISELLLLLNVLEIRITVDRSLPGPSQLGVTFDTQLIITKVVTGQAAPLLGERMGLQHLVHEWELSAIDGVKVSYKMLAKTFADKIGKFEITFKRKLKEAELYRDPSSQSLGVRLSTRSTIVEHIESNSPAAVGGLGYYLGWKVCTVEGHRIVDASDLANRAHQKKIVTLGLARVHCRRHIAVTKSADEKLGVSFSPTLTINGTVSGGVGDKAGFTPFTDAWKVVAVRDKHVASIEALSAQISASTSAASGKPVTIRFTLAPISSEDRYEAALSAGNHKRAAETRGVHIKKRAINDSTGIITTESLVVDTVHDSGAEVDGIGDLIGWRIEAVNGTSVSCRTEYKAALEGKQEYTLSLVLEDANLPSNFVEVSLSEDVELKTLHDAFSRYGDIVEMMHPEPVKNIPCMNRDCLELPAVVSQFCESCGARVVNTMSPYICHIRFGSVQTAQWCLANPPLGGAILKMKFYHPVSRSQPAHTEQTAAPKQSVLQLANCLGFNNAYLMLGVPRDATDAEISKTFREKSRWYHTDKQHGSNSCIPEAVYDNFTEKDKERVASGDMFKSVKSAYEVLKDSDERAKLEQSIEKAVTAYGSKQVNARFPRRTETGEFDCEVKAPTATGGGTDETHHEKNIYAGYTTTTAGDGGGGGAAGVGAAAGYQGLSTVEVMPKEYNPNQVFDASDPGHGGRRVTSYPANHARKRKKRPRAQPTWDEDYDWEEETFTPVTPAPADDEYDPLEMGAELPIKRSRI